MIRATLIIACIFFVIACHQKQLMTDFGNGQQEYKATNSKTELTCKMLPEELRLRKETVLASLKSKMLDRKELRDGYAFKFSGSDDVVDELVEFIKTERECCDFFVFNLSVSGDKSVAWLEMTGVEGAKDFITHELGL
ncbi:MAG TPA: hypothetical protein VMZ69_08105 [Saprospiraceae bacterium]|nr:hypothetical protein [Saprospiraceae bacterium]